MGEQLIHHVTDVRMLNDKNVVLVSILVNSIWDKVMEYPYIHISGQLNIPILVSGNKETLNYPFALDVEVKNIPRDTMRVETSVEFLENYDREREITSKARVTGFYKVI